MPAETLDNTTNTNINLNTQKFDQQFSDLTSTAPFPDFGGQDVKDEDEDNKTLITPDVEVKEVEVENENEVDAPEIKPLDDKLKGPEELQKLQLNEKTYSLFTECEIKHDYDPDTDAIMYSNVNLLDFLGRIYEFSTSKTRRGSNYKKYLSVLGYSKSGEIPVCKFIKTSNHAVTPEKNNPTDEGYDVTITKEDKKISENTTRYDTEIKMEIPPGWHIELYPRSSLSNSGYMLANSVGISI